MTPEELRALPFGAVVHDMDEDRYYRKGRWDTWYPIDQATGERVGQRDAVRSAYLPRFHPNLTDSTAETQRLSRVRQVQPADRHE